MAIYPFFCRMAADRVWNETLCVWSLSGCVVTWWSWSAPSPPHCVERSVVAGLGMPELAMSKAWKCVLAKVCLPFCMLTSDTAVSPVTYPHTQVNSSHISGTAFLPRELQADHCYQLILPLAVLHRVPQVSRRVSKCDGVKWAN